MSEEVRTTTTSDLKGFLTKHMDAIQSVAASVITPEKMVRLVCAAATRQPELAQCTPMSILNAMMQAATYGLGVCDGSNDAYLVPYSVKVKINGQDTWQKQAQFIPGYQGLVKKAIESNKVTNIDAHVVFENDVFDYQYGQAPSLIHKPTLKAKGEVIAAYAIAYFPDGKFQFEVMPIDELNDIEGRSKSKKDGKPFGPWVTDKNEMRRKTAVRRLYKYIPKSSAMAALLEIQAKAESGDFIVEGEIIGRPGDAPTPELPARVMNEDGELVWEWTEDEKAFSLNMLHADMDDISRIVPIESVDKIYADYKAKIGIPDLSPEKWANRLRGACDRAIEKTKKKA